MKRYLSSILIIVVTILSIGTYYAQLTSYASNLPELTFKTVEGDEKELQSLILSGYLEDGRLNELFSFDYGKTTYQKERSYFEQLDNFFIPSNDRLEKEYRSFMRGKQYYDMYYEDKDNLTFVTTKMDDDGNRDPVLFIDSLEKKDKDVKSFKVALPDQDKYNTIFISDVQFSQSKLQVITENEMSADVNKIELHHYTIDLATEKIVSDETILSETFDATNDEGHFALPFKANGIPNNMFLFADVKGSYSDGEGFKEKVGASSLYSYHLDTKKLEKIKIPKDLAITYDNVGSDFSYDENNLYMRMQGAEEEESRVFTFDLKKQQLINKFKLNAVGYTEIKDGRIFAITADELLIADLLSGKTLYKGNLQFRSNDQKKNPQQRIQLSQVYFK